MALKLIMNWDIEPAKEQEYFEFVVREFIPGVQQLGFELTDAWATVYGDQPQIMVGAILPGKKMINSVLETSEWKSLNNQLLDFVKNYTYKIVEARSGFQF